MTKRKHLIKGVLPMLEIQKVFKLLSENQLETVSGADSSSNQNQPVIIERSLSEISRLTGISRSTIREYKLKAEAKNLNFLDLSKMTELELSSIFKSKSKGRKLKSSSLDYEYILKELLKKGVTKQLLFKEYLRAENNPISYSAYCSRIREYKRNNKISMKQHHKAGESLFIDYSGLTVPIKTINGEFKAQIYVASMGVSNYTYVEATSSQKVRDFVSSTARALSFLGRVPEKLVPDNLKSAVIKASKDLPQINKTFNELANYYNTIVTPARVRKPQDKAIVENSVKLIQQQILAPLRNKTFQNLSELNLAIKPLLKDFNDRVMKKYNASRFELFNKIEKDQMIKLPASEYEVKEWKKSKVSPDYHIQINNCYYSVPYRFIGKYVDVCIKDKTVEIYDSYEQIAIHKKILNNSEFNETKYRYSTFDDHMPESHIFMKNWTREKVIGLARSIGTNTLDYVENIFKNAKHEALALRSLMSLDSMNKKHSNELIEQAVIILIKQNIYNMKYLKNEISSILKEDQIVVSKITEIKDNSNIRGNDYYKLN